MPMRKGFRGVVVVVSVLGFSVSGCAKRAHEVQATYTPSARYSSMTCDQIGEELNRVAADVARVSGKQDDAAQRDAIVTGVGLVLFWPALLVLAAGDDAEELSRLKGEYEALDRARAEKRCTGSPGS